MRSGNTKVFGSAAVLMGTIIGAGIFTLPAVAASAGFLVMLAWTVVLTIALIPLHLMFAEIVVRTKSKHRLPGYVGIYLGKKLKIASLATTLIGATGTLLVYLVLFGQFIPAILPVSEVPAVVVTWVILSALVLLGIRTIEKVELGMVALLIGVIFFLAFSALPQFSAPNLVVLGDDIFLPFGVLLFALGGFMAIPEIRGFFIGEERKYAKSIVLGLLSSAFLYVLFTGSFVGAFGANISEDLTDTAALLGSVPLYALTGFGIIAISTSFLVLGSYLINTLQADIGLSKKVSVTVLAVPLILYLLGIRGFVNIVSFLGAIFFGVDAFFLLFTWKRARHMTKDAPYKLNIPEWIIYPLFILFGSGVVLVLWNSFL